MVTRSDLISEKDTERITNSGIETESQVSSRRTRAAQLQVAQSKWPTRSLGVFLQRSLVVHMVTCLVAIAMAAHALQTMYWNSQTVAIAMWTSILVLFLASFMLLVDFYGYVAVEYENRYLLVMYISFLIITSMILFAICVTSIIDVAHLSNILDDDVGYVGYLPVGVSSGKALKTLWGYHVIMTSACLASLVVSFVPLIYSFKFEYRIRTEALDLEERIQKKIAERKTRSKFLGLSSSSLRRDNGELQCDRTGLSEIRDRYSGSSSPTALETSDSSALHHDRLFAIGNSEREERGEAEDRHEDDIDDEIELGEESVNVFRKMMKPEHLRTVLRLSNYISLVSSVVMVCYGAYSLNYLFSLNFGFTVFAVYGLVYGGVIVMLTGILGLWVAATAYRSVVRLYYVVLIPILFGTLLSNLVICFYSVHGVEGAVLQDFRQGALRLTDLVPGESVEAQLNNVSVAVQSQVLVGGVLDICIILFQASSTVTAMQLFKSLQADVDVKKKRRVQKGSTSVSSLPLEYDILQDSSGCSIWSFGIFGLMRAIFGFDSDIEERLSSVQKLCIFWGICTGIFSIFYNGTFVIFNSWNMNSVESGNHETAWIVSAWELMGRYDARYVQSNGFLVSSDSFLVLIVGPLTLHYSWATFLQYPSSHISGIASAIIMIYTQLLYYAIEFHIKFSDISLDDLPLFICAFVLMNMLRILLPFLVLIRETQVVLKRIEVTTDVEFLTRGERLSVSSEVDPLLMDSNCEHECERISGDFSCDLQDCITPSESQGRRIYQDLNSPFKISAISAFDQFKYSECIRDAGELKHTKKVMEKGRIR